MPLGPEEQAALDLIGESLRADEVGVNHAAVWELESDIEEKRVEAPTATSTASPVRAETIFKHVADNSHAGNDWAGERS